LKNKKRNLKMKGRKNLMMDKTHQKEQRQQVL
jgi:hypothetical protein